MKVFVNDQQIDEVKNVSELYSLLHDLQIECTKEQNILQVFVNGQYVENFPQDLVDEGIESIEIFLKSSEDLLVESLAESIQYIPKLLEGLREFVRYIQEGKHRDGIQMFQQCLDGLIWINQILSSINCIFIGENEVKSRELYHDISERFILIVKELMEAWENEDYVLISDLVEYELVPHLEEVHKLFVHTVDVIIQGF